MQFENYTINIKDDKEIENLNLFLRQSRVISVTKNLIQKEIDKDYLDRIF